MHIDSVRETLWAFMLPALLSPPESATRHRRRQKPPFIVTIHTVQVRHTTAQVPARSQIYIGIRIGASTIPDIFTNQRSPAPQADRHLLQILVGASQPKKQIWSQLL